MGASPGNGSFASTSRTRLCAWQMQTRIAFQIYACILAMHRASSNQLYTVRFVDVEPQRPLLNLLLALPYTLLLVKRDALDTHVAWWHTSGARSALDTANDIDKLEARETPKENGDLVLIVLATGLSLTPCLIALRCCGQFHSRRCTSRQHK